MQLQRDQLSIGLGLCKRQGADDVPSILFAEESGNWFLLARSGFGRVVYELIRIRSQMKRDYPLNLSILIRGGKENNNDSPSNGE